MPSVFATTLEAEVLSGTLTKAKLTVAPSVPFSPSFDFVNVCETVSVIEPSQLIEYSISAVLSLSPNEEAFPNRTVSSVLSLSISSKFGLASTVMFVALAVTLNCPVLGVPLVGVSRVAPLNTLISVPEFA